ncbi:tRNA (adenosine(37)-N6)-dimethylallyltransferase MiaA [Blattabacterium cuenoti]|uniref:tRNA (adenosine(37)-N6)-dimethylallyltransferase MiaA n=1 Tax=Blattabacterium cuenoti TaxID=1653831 RepID=UPI00163CE812|nr:tRNA (adenosine(37)-N6)-dimethylallyltransferase MiaA [Blattabacterium cuenoti]
MKNKFIITIIGPTGVGKTKISLFIAKKLNTEIISSDSRQFYRELKIGSSMPNINDLSYIKHHFIGHLSIFQNYNAKLFEIDSLNKITKLFNKYSTIIMVGGSGLYEKAVTEGLSFIPDINLNIKKQLISSFKKNGIKFLQKEFKLLNINEKIDINNPVRLIRYLEIIKSTGHCPSFFFKKKKLYRNFNIIKIGLILSKKEIYFNIKNRINNMVNNGLIEEAIKLFPYRNLRSLQTIGYKEIFNFIKEKKNIYSEIKNITNLIEINTRKYIKKQITWYRKDKKIKWFNPKEKYNIIDFINQKLQ